jgi:hypothetical protein
VRSKAAELSEHKIGSIVAKRIVILEHAVVAGVDCVEVAQSIETNPEGSSAQAVSADHVLGTAHIRDKISLTEHLVRNGVGGKRAVVPEHAVVLEVGDEEVPARIRRQT